MLWTLYIPDAERRHATSWRCRATLLRTTAIQATALLMFAGPAHAQLAPMAQPQNGRVVAGQASITQTSTLTSVQQSSPSAVVDWKSFNIGSSNTVTFQQPSASSTTLNKVSGPDPSIVAGRITANGNVIIVNGSGVIFDKGSQVEANSVIVSTAGIRTRDFMAGNLNFSKPGSPNARIVNNGTITVKQAGLAALVAPSVANHGVISAKMGTVVLAGATTHTVDLYGDKLLAIDITGQVTQVPVDARGRKVDALVTNTGTILAEGGTVQLSASAADGIVTNLVTAGGKISTSNPHGVGGTIVVGGIGGSLVVEGDLSARGATGGAVQVLSDRGVSVTSKAKINASGRNGGGVVAVGTTLARARGGASLTGEPLSNVVSVSKGATIKADATRNGNGGTVAVLSKQNTTMSGTVTSRGGSKGGDGGSIEVSGKNFVLDGRVDTSAVAGNQGTLTLDPTDIDIIHGEAGGGNLDGTFVGGTIDSGNPNASPLPNEITDGEIHSIGLTSTVRLQATDMITVEGAATISVAHGFTLEAGNGITLQGSPLIRATGGDIVFATGSEVPFAPYPGGETPNITVSGQVGSNLGNVYLLAGKNGAVTFNSSAPGLSPNSVYAPFGTIAVIADSVSVAPYIYEDAVLPSTYNFVLSSPRIQIAPASISTVSLGGGTAGLVLDGPVISAADNGGVNFLTIGSAITPSAPSTPITTASSIDVAGTVSIHNTLSLIADGPISVNSTLSAKGATLDAGSALVTVANGAVISGTNTILLQGGALTIDGTVNDGGANPGSGTLTLAANGPGASGTIDASSGTLVVGTLTGSSTDVAILTGANQINNLGAFVAHGSGFDLTDWSTTTPGTLSVIGSVNGGNNTTIDVVANPVTVTGAGSVSGANAAVIEGSSVSLSAGSAVQSSAGNIYLLAGAGGSVGIDAATIGGASTNNISIIGDLLSIASAASIKATDIQIAPASPTTTVNLGGGSGGLVIGPTAIAAIKNNPTITIGEAITPTSAPNPILSAPSINVAGPVDVGTNTLLLYANGPIAVGSAASAGNTTIDAVGGVVTVAAGGEVTGKTAALLEGNSVTVNGTIDDGGMGGSATIKTVADTGTIGEATGLISAGTVDLVATGSGASIVLNGGQIVATTGTIGVNTPLAFVQSGVTISAANTARNITFNGSVTQNSPSVISANGAVSVAGSLSENGGTLVAVGNINLGSLIETAGTVSAGNALTIGSGTGIAGWAGSVATAGTFDQSGGVADAAGAVNIFSTGGLTQSAGTLAAGGTLGVTAATGIDVNGTISAAGVSSGFMLLANTGNATIETQGELAGANVSATGDAVEGNALQAPSGTVLFAGPGGSTVLPFGLGGSVSSGTAAVGYALGASVPIVTAGTVTTPTMPTASVFDAETQRMSAPGGVIPAVLIGSTIDIERALVATEFALYAKSLIVEGAAGSIQAGVVTGSTGVSRGGALPAGLTALTWSKSGATNIGWQNAGLDVIGSALLSAPGTIAAGALSGAVNVIGTLSDFAATGNFALTDFPSGANPVLAQTNTLMSGSGGADSYGGAPTGPNSLSLTVAGTLDVTGTVQAGISGANPATPGGDILLASNTIPGGQAAAPGSIDISGAVTASSGVDQGGTLTLISGGRITEGGGTAIGAGVGTISAAELTGFSAGSATLDDLTNAVPNLGSFSAAGSFVLRSGAQTVDVTGPVSVTGTAGSLLLQAGTRGGTNDLNLNATTIAADAVTLLAPGNIDATGAMIAASTLALPSSDTGSLGSAAGVGSARSIALGGTGAAPINQIGTLNSVVSENTLVLTDATSLTLNGNISAPSIQIGVVGSIAVAGGVTVSTGFQALPLVGRTQPPQDSDGVTGLNLSILSGPGEIDLGPNLSIQGISGSEATVRLALTDGGSIRFGTFNAAGANLQLDVGSGSAVSSGGNISVAALSVFYQGGFAGPVNLSGAVGGVAGTGAAGIGRIGQQQSAPSAFAAGSGFTYVPGQTFQINQCIISSLTCGTSTSTALQVFATLPLFATVQSLIDQASKGYLVQQPLLHPDYPYPLAQGELDDPDLLLPYISDRDN